MEQLAFFFYNKKVCTVCKEEKSLDQFDKQVGGRDGLRANCIECRRAIVSQYFARNPEARKRRSKRKKKYYEAHKEAIKARVRKRAKDNPQKARESCYKWIRANPDRFRAIQRKWERANPDKMHAKRARRRAHKAGDGGSFTAEEWQALCEKYGNKCLCCGTSDKPLTHDHVIPISKGGSSNIENIQPLCGSCNSRKCDKVIDYR